MICYERICVSKAIDINKTSESKECDFCHYWYFLDKGFNLQSYACNRCHGLVMMSINLNDIAILNIKSANYCCIISAVTKSEAINLL